MWRSIKNVAEVECGSAELSLNRVLVSWVNSWLPGLWLWLPLGLAQRSGPPGVAPVPQAHPGHVQPLRLHAHARHVLPDGLAAVEDTGLGEQPSLVPGNAGTWPGTRSPRRGPHASPTASPTERPGKLGPMGPPEDAMTALPPGPQLGPCPSPRLPSATLPRRLGASGTGCQPRCAPQSTPAPPTTSIPGWAPSGPASSHRAPGSARKLGMRGGGEGPGGRPAEPPSDPPGQARGGGLSLSEVSGISLPPTPAGQASPRNEK